MLLLFLPLKGVREPMEVDGEQNVFFHKCASGSRLQVHYYRHNQPSNGVIFVCMINF